MELVSKNNLNNLPIAIVTGAGRGVGREISLHLARKNYFVMLLGKKIENLLQCQKEISKCGFLSDIFPVDVSKAEQVKNCIDSIIKKYKKIDLLFNNAAILKRGTTEISDDEVEELIKTNLNGVIFVAKRVADQMKTQKNGYIVNVSSLGGKIAAPFAGVYAASKFGVCGFSEALTKEMAAYDVKVTVICPSMIATDMAGGRKFNPDAMIQISDIKYTLDYLLQLSKNALPSEISIQCLPLIKANSKFFKEIYLEN